MQVSEESEELDQRTFSVVGSTADQVYRSYIWFAVFANGKRAVFNITSLVNSCQHLFFYYADIMRLV